MEHPLRMDDLGVPPFQEMPIYYTGLSENRGMPSSNLVGGAITILKNMSSSMVSDDIPYTVYIYIMYEMENNPAMFETTNQQWVIICYHDCPNEHGHASDVPYLQTHPSCERAASREFNDIYRMQMW